MLRRLDPIIGHDLYAGCCAECSDQPEVTEIRMSDAAKFGFDDQSLKHSPWAEEVRELWERFGTDVMRREDVNYWVDKAFDAIPTEADRVVFTDVRFDNEAGSILDLRDAEITSSLWQITRPGVRGGGWGDHAAEQLAGQLGEEVQIINEGTLDDLAAGVAEALELVINNKIPGQMAFDLPWTGIPADRVPNWGLMKETND